MAAPLLSDEDLPSYFAGLGLPGAVDIHVHFMPEPVMRKVWSYFENSPLPWPVRYRFDETTRLETLRKLGVIAHTALLYPHKAGMAAWLNEWGAEFGANTDGCVPTGTFFPEPGVVGYVAHALERGIRVFKSHLQVGAYDPADALLDSVWGMLADARVPVVCHCGSGPMPGTFTFVEQIAPFPPELRPRLADLGDRIVLGSDYPNIPYPYAHQIEVLARLDLGDGWLRAVLHDNGARLLR